MVEDLLTMIDNQMDTFSKGQKRIALYIKEHYNKAAFMTASKLGSIVGVSESTVVRFATEIGFDGYPKLQKSLQSLIRNKLTSVQRMEAANEQIGTDDVLEKVLSSDIEKLRKTLEETSVEDFDRAANSLIRAKRIYITGVRSAYALANFLAFYCNLIFDDVKLINTTSSSEMFEQILNIDQTDVLVAISFPRYSQRTVKAVRYAKDNKAHVVAITDSTTSPLCQYADNVLLAQSDMASFVDSLVAPMSLINALIVAVGLKKKDEISMTFSKLERIWDEYNVYEKTVL